MDIKPEKLLEQLGKQLEFLEKAKSMSVKVGLPSSKASVNHDGVSIITIGAAHEYGEGDMRRSFLREPFLIKRTELARIIEDQFDKGSRGDVTAERALGVIGALASGISKQSFSSGGFGAWADIKPETKARKGSSAILIDTGALRQAITWELSNNAS